MGENMGKIALTIIRISYKLCKNSMGENDVLNIYFVLVYQYKMNSSKCTNTIIYNR